MKSFRYLLSIAVIAALAAGYACSQYFYIGHRAPEWTGLIDTPLVAWVALIVLLGAIALSLRKEEA